MFFTNNNISSKIIENFLTEKKTRDKQILIKLRAKNIIITFGKLFVISQKKEINKLLIKGVFKLISNNFKKINN